VVRHEHRDYFLVVESVKKLRGSAWFPMAFASLATYEDFVLNAYFWLMLGLLFRLPTLALSAEFANTPAPAAGTRRRAG
jgi:hypothetical protein